MERSNMSNKTKIFGVGISGLVGSRLMELLPQIAFDNLSLDTGVNIMDPSTLDVIRDDHDHPFVLHLAAKADVDGCEADKPLGEEGAAYKINVLGTKNVVEACKATNKKIIYISTDFVFDGKLTPEGGYKEEDTPNPINWYGQTKYDGEELIRNSGLPYIIVRIAYPFQKEAFALKKDFYHAIEERLKEGQQVTGITDHMMTPTYLDDIAFALGKLVEVNAEGIYHVVGSQSLSPYDAARTIAEMFGYDKSLVTKTTRAEFFKDRAPRPFDLTMNNDKIEKFGVKMKGFSDALKDFR
jgi:dTDP-4-dehydrorhamnose reductase